MGCHNEGGREAYQEHRAVLHGHNGYLCDVLRGWHRRRRVGHAGDAALQHAWHRVAAGDFKHQLERRQAVELEKQVHAHNVSASTGNRIGVPTHLEQAILAAYQRIHGSAVCCVCHAFVLIRERVRRVIGFVSATARACTGAVRHRCWRNRRRRFTRTGVAVQKRVVVV